MNRPDPLSSGRRASLGATRMALLVGVLMFGGITWYTRRGDPMTTTPNIDLLYKVGYGVLVLAVVGIVVIRNKLAGVTDPAKYANLAVLGWSCGEAAAIYGGVYYFLSGDPSRYLTGVLLMLISFVAIPLRRT